MVSIFTKTTTILAAEFMENFAAEKLTLALFKVGQETGIECNREHHTITIAGHWNDIIKAHSSLEHILEDEINCRGRLRHDLIDASDLPTDGPVTDNSKEKRPFLVINDDGKPGRKPGNTVKQPSENSIVPEPVVLYQYQEKSLMNQEILRPANLLNAIDDKAQDNSEIKQLITNKTKADANEEEEKVSSQNESNYSLKGNSTKAQNGNIKTEDPLTEVHMSDTPDNELSDEDTDIDEQYLTLESLNPGEVVVGKDKVIDDLKTKVKLEKIEKELPSEKGKWSRRKSKPVKYIATSDDTEESEKEIEMKETKKRKGRPPKIPSLKIVKLKDKKFEKVKVEKIKAEKPKRKRTRKKVEEENTEYHCDLCSYTGTKKSNLKEHVKRKHLNRFTCDVCQKQFGFNKDLNRHKTQVHAEPAHFCDVCNKFYKSKRVYDDHILTHKENYVKPNYDCKMCEKTFSTKYVLAAHFKAEHLGMKKSYMCPTCGRTFTQKNSYVMHANVHAGIKPYVCDICGKAFTYDKSLKEHKFMHDSIRRFQCHICSKTFRQSTSLRIHMKVHKETKDYMCTSCGKGFTQKQALLRHERIHSGDKPYICSLCSRTFSDYSIIRRHMMLIHKKDPKDWRSDIISNLKRKKDYYIDGGPGHHVRELKSAEEVKMKTPTEPYEFDISSQVDNIVEKLDNDNTLVQHKDESQTSKDEETQPVQMIMVEQMTSENDSSVQNHIQDLSQSHVHLSQPVFPAHSSYSSNILLQQQQQLMQVSNTDTKVSDSHQNSSSPMPINYSIPVNYSTNVTVPNSTVSEGSLSSRYQSLVESYRAQGHSRDIYGAGVPSAISTMAGLSEQLRGQINTDTSQPQHLPNPWVYPSYPPYYNPANFPQYQGPQN